MHELFSRLTAWLAPIICFTAEEARGSPMLAIRKILHLRQYDAVPGELA